MSEQLISNMRELATSMQDNASLVEQKLATSSAESDQAVISSVSKYHRALERLADE